MSQRETQREIRRLLDEVEGEREEERHRRRRTEIDALRLRARFDEAVELEILPRLRALLAELERRGHQTRTLPRAAGLLRVEVMLEARRPASGRLELELEAKQPMVRVTAKRGWDPLFVDRIEVSELTAERFSELFLRFLRELAR